MTDYDREALRLHKEFKGKIHTALNDQLDSLEKLKYYYTPGVGSVSLAINKDPSTLRDYTWVGNTVAVISDGSAVLGLGNIGPKASMPVMEGKCLLFKYFANINAVPIILNVHEPDEIINTVKALADSFGGINLEDIAAPKCFEIEARLSEILEIPVFHDDQHGTAIVALAGLINSAKVVNKDLNQCRITLSGVGAAGVAITKLVKSFAPGAKICAVDSKGIISSERVDLNTSKRELLYLLNPVKNSGSLVEAIKGSDIFIGVSSPDLLTPEMVKSMTSDPIIFAMANPDPEIKPELAHKAGAAVVATGRSDYPNQVNNALVFPGIFRGALDHGVQRITEEHKLSAALAIAHLVPNPTPDRIIPGLDDKNLVKVVASVIR